MLRTTDAHNFTYVKLAQEQIYGKPKINIKSCQMLRLSELFQELNKGTIYKILYIVPLFMNLQFYKK